jgi:peptidoglycan/LPS O-acetylase OafA/YrhL
MTLVATARCRPSLDARVGRGVHVEALDGLRGIAALAVIFNHAIQTFLSTGLPHAYLAVDFFFMLSGFVIAKAYDARLLGSMTLPGFAYVRLLRLYPLIFCGVVLGSLVIMGRPGLTDSVSPEQLALAICLALLTLPSTALSSVHPNLLYPINITHWSLFFELLANFFYALLRRVLTTRVLLLVVTISAAVHVLVTKHYRGIDVGYVSGTFVPGFARVTFPFFAGVLIYRRLPTLSLSGYAVAPLAITLLGALTLPIFTGTWMFDTLAIILLFPLIVIAGASCRNGTALGAPSLLLGELSYPIYATHQPLLRLVANAARMVGRPWPLFSLVFVSISLCLAFAFLASRLFDLPVRAYLSEGLRRRRASAS